MKSILSVLMTTSLLIAYPLIAQNRPADDWVGFNLNQLQQLSSSVFELLDADENGSITIDEIDLLNQEVEETLSEEDRALVQQRLNLVNHYFWADYEIDRFQVGDTNNDGSMNRAEFDSLESSVRTHMLELGISSLDSDKNGSVEANEFSAHLNKFNEWDSDENGKIDRKELANISDRRLLIDIRRRWAARSLAREERKRIASEIENRAVDQERAKKRIESD